MNQKNILKTIPSVALAAAILLGPVTANAQSGSRLCGWVADVTSEGKVVQVIGNLYEARSDDPSYAKQCDGAINDMSSAIKSDPKMNALTWTKVFKWTCTSIGERFVSKTHGSSDMCAFMVSKTPYQVVKDNIANTTVYTQK